MTYKDLTVLVTGGTGSFGHTVAKRLLAAGVGELRVFSRDESKQDQMRQDFQDPRVKFYIGDVRNYDSVDRAVKGSHHIFHAAALKQVPSSEFFPIEAVKTNILGSDNVLRASERYQVQSLVMLSTDKAVRPANTMGMTKALMEKVAMSHGLMNPNSKTTVSCIRYGNVMYSRGSVIPLFVRQVKEGKNLSITNPEMTRFMMSLDHSFELVDFALKNANQGDLFIQKAPACTIADLAQAIINLFNANVGIDVIGTRHAEKVSEMLATADELARADDMGDYFRIQSDKRDLNYELAHNRVPNKLGFQDFDSHTVKRLSVAEIETLLLTLPEIRKELE